MEVIEWLLDWFDEYFPIIVLSIPVLLGFAVAIYVDIAYYDEHDEEIVGNAIPLVEEIEFSVVNTKTKLQPIIQEPKRPLLATQVDSASGRMTVELSDGMKAVFVVALIVCCFALVMGYRVAARLIRKEDVT